MLSIKLSIYVQQFNFTDLVRKALLTTDNSVETEGKRCEVILFTQLVRGRVKLSNMMLVYFLRPRYWPVLNKPSWLQLWSIFILCFIYLEWSFPRSSYFSLFSHLDKVCGCIYYFPLFLHPQLKHKHRESRDFDCLSAVVFLVPRIVPAVKQLHNDRSLNGRVSGT